MQDISRRKTWCSSKKNHGSLVQHNDGSIVSLTRSSSHTKQQATAHSTQNNPVVVVGVSFLSLSCVFLFETLSREVSKPLCNALLSILIEE